MSVVNYSISYLGRGEYIITWTGLVSGDTGQEFDLTGYKTETIHGYRTSAGNIAALLGLSNESSVPSHLFDYMSVGETIAIAMESFVDGSKCRWIAPKSVTGTGTLNLHLLVKEV